MSDPTAHSTDGGPCAACHHSRCLLGIVIEVQNRTNPGQQPSMSTTAVAAASSATAVDIASTTTPAGHVTGNSTATKPKVLVSLLPTVGSSTRAAGPSTVSTIRENTSNTSTAGPRPSTSNTTRPSTSNTIRPSTSNTTRPSTSNIIRPSTSNTIRTSTSNTSRPSTSNTTRPSTSNTTRPSMSNPTRAGPSTRAVPEASTSATTPIIRVPVPRLVANNMAVGLSTDNTDTPGGSTATAGLSSALLGGKCKWCGLVLANKRNLLRHAIMKHPGELAMKRRHDEKVKLEQLQYIVCAFCKNAFPYYKALRNHLIGRDKTVCNANRMKAGSDNKLAEELVKQIEKKWEFNYSVRAVHQVATVNQQECAKVSQSQGGTSSQHPGIAGPQSSRHCPFCTETFDSILKKHYHIVNTHHDLFNARKRHEKLVAQDKLTSQICPICQASFKSWDSLQYHLKYLSSANCKALRPKDFNALEIIQKFQNRWAFDPKNPNAFQEFIGEDGSKTEASVNCPFCEKEFTNRNSRFHHVKTKHPDLKKLQQAHNERVNQDKWRMQQCPYCMSIVSNWDALGLHLRRPIKSCEPKRGPNFNAQEAIRNYAKRWEFDLTKPKAFQVLSDEKRYKEFKRKHEASKAATGTAPSIRTFLPTTPVFTPPIPPSWSATISKERSAATPISSTVTGATSTPGNVTATVTIPSNITTTTNNPTHVTATVPISSNVSTTTNTPTQITATVPISSSVSTTTTGPSSEDENIFDREKRKRTADELVPGLWSGLADIVGTPSPKRQRMGSPKEKQQVGSAKVDESGYFDASCVTDESNLEDESTSSVSRVDNRDEDDDDEPSKDSISENMESVDAFLGLDDTFGQVDTDYIVSRDDASLHPVASPTEQEKSGFLFNEPMFFDTEENMDEDTNTATDSSTDTRNKVLLAALDDISEDTLNSFLPETMEDNDDMDDLDYLMPIIDHLEASRNVRLSDAAASSPRDLHKLTDDDQLVESAEPDEFINLADPKELLEGLDDMDESLFDNLPNQTPYHNPDFDQRTESVRDEDLGQDKDMDADKADNNEGIDDDDSEMTALSPIQSPSTSQRSPKGSFKIPILPPSRSPKASTSSSSGNVRPSTSSSRAAASSTPKRTKGHKGDTTESVPPGSDRPFWCPYCRRRLKNKDSLNIHIEKPCTKSVPASERRLNPSDPKLQVQSVQCVKCGKWRAVYLEFPNQYDDVDWTCRDNPERKYSKCSVPESERVSDGYPPDESESDSDHNTESTSARSQSTTEGEKPRKSSKKGSKKSARSQSTTEGEKPRKSSKKGSKKR